MLLDGVPQGAVSFDESLMLFFRKLYNLGFFQNFS